MSHSLFVTGPATVRLTWATITIGAGDETWFYTEPGKQIEWTREGQVFVVSKPASISEGLFVADKIGPHSSVAYVGGRPPWMKQ